MDFFQNTINWIKGELLEAWLILSFGLFTIVLGVLFYKLGGTQGSRTLLWPLILTGIIYSAIGSGMLYSNYKRLTKFPEHYKTNHSKFILSEKERVEDFQYGYTVSKIVASLFFTTTLFLFWFSKSPFWQSIGIGLAYFALAGLVVDYFSQERANNYYFEIIKASDFKDLHIKRQI